MSEEYTPSPSLIPLNQFTVDKVEKICSLLFSKLLSKPHLQYV